MKKKRYIKQKNLRNRLAIPIVILITAVTVLCAVKICQIIFPSDLEYGYIPTSYGKHISKNVKLAQDLQLPDWIDKQIISVHSTARTGAHLNDIKNIVIHYVGNPGTTAQNNRDYYEKKDTEVSSHFVVGLKGEVIQCVPLWEKSAASNERNGDTISIEVCHPDDSGKFNDETYNSVVELTAWLCETFDLDEDDVIRHYDITEKICPKYYVENPKEWKKFKEDVENKLNEYEQKATTA